MTIDTATLPALADKDVLLVLKANVEETIEGTVAGASEHGIAFKRKGRRDLELITVDQVESIEKAPTKPTKISQRKTLPVALERVRSHLANDHGIGLAWLNQASNEDALAFHATIDHADLAHNHEKVEGEAAPAAEAPAAAAETAEPEAA
jgi:hypothetical protein